MTLDDFLIWSAHQPSGRYELVDGEVVARPGESGGHNLVKPALYIALRDAARAAGFAGTVFTDGMTVRIGEHHGREPDAAVACAPIADRRSRLLPDPLIVCKVVSPSTERDDTTTPTGAKLVECFSVPSIEHYLIVQLEVRAILHHCRGLDGAIATRIIKAGMVRLAPPGLEFAAEPVLDA